MKDNITNHMNLESRMWNPLTLDTYDQNDTIYYYSCMFDEVRNFTEVIGDGDFPDWLYTRSSVRAWSLFPGRSPGQIFL